MQIIESRTFDAERALYGQESLKVRACRFDGPADGESAFKECRQIVAEQCYFNLRYPFWHDHGLRIVDSEMTDKCRAALWYSEHIELEQTKLHGIKALRECADVTMKACDVVSPEFGWSVRGIRMTDCTAQSEYFMLRAVDLTVDSLRFSGKYSFQYIERGAFDHCDFDTKDAFWHAKDVTIRNSVVRGEYLAWYSDGLTFENCTIIGTQPLCYCKHLRLIDCRMLDTDLSFEKSDVTATLLSPIVSIKNPHSGLIRVPSAGEIIMDDPDAKGSVACVGV